VTRKLDHQDIPDPVADKCDMLEEKINRLNKELDRLQEQLKEARR